MAEKADLRRLLRPRSIAMVGGSAAAMVVRQCLKMGFDGEIWPVHPKKTEVEGLTAYCRIEDLPAAPDATFIGVNRHLTLEVVKSLAACDAGGAVCYASGFLEADDTGAKLQSELLALAGEMPILGPNCYGVINYADGALLWPDQHGGQRLEANESGVAIIMQSSNMAINLTMQRRGLPLAYMLTAGNQAMVGVPDLAMAVLDDSRVSCLGLHIEGFDSITKMEALARKARQLNKPIVALKVGKSEQAQQATLSHTASLAGAYAASQAFLQRIGVGQVETLPALLEALKLLHVHGTLGGYRLGSMSCSGGEASIMADAAQSRKVYFPALYEAEKHSVQKVLGPLVSVSNPLDYHTYIWANLSGMQAVYAGMLQADHDLTILVLDFPREDSCCSDDWDIALAAFEAAVNEVNALRCVDKQWVLDDGEKKRAKAVVTVSLPENIPERVVRQLIQKGIAVVNGIEETLVAAEVAADIGATWQKPEPLPVLSVSNREAVDSRIPTTGQSLVSSVSENLPENEKGRSHESVILDEATAKAQLSSFDVPVPQGKTVSCREEAIAAGQVLAYPLVLKALGIAHKTEQNAVRLNLKSETELANAFSELSCLSEHCYLEVMVCEPVAELIIGISRDPQFGLIMTLGAGGVLVELLKDSATILMPACEEEVLAALNSLQTAPLLKGYRGRPAADMTATIDAILAIQRYAIHHAACLQELDINPLILCAEGLGVYAADALIIQTQGVTYV